MSSGKNGLYGRTFGPVVLIGMGVAFVYALPFLGIFASPQFWQMVIGGVLLIYGFMWVVSLLLGGGKEEGS